MTAEIHRLDIERVRLEHEKGAAEREQQRLGQAVHALSQEQSDLTTTLHLLDEEIQRHHSLVQTHTEEKAERERTLMQKQAALAELAQADETAANPMRTAIRIIFIIVLLL